MSIIVWPVQLIPVQDVMFAPQNVSRGGGTTLSGFEQVAASNAGRWRASLTCTIHRPAQRLALSAMMAQSEGRANLWRVPVSDTYLLPTTLRPVARPPVTPFDAGERFEDGSSFTASEVTGTLDVAIDRGATELLVNQEADYAPHGGLYFNIGNRLHSAIEVTEESTDLYRVKFWPPAREDATEATIIDWQRPNCLMRLASDESGAGAYRSLRFKTITLDFVEAF